MRALVAVTTALACQSAYADAPVSEPTDRQVVSPYWGSTLAADGVALTLVAVGIAADAEPATLLGVSTYLVGAPLMHMTNNRYGHASASVAMRVGLPLLGLVIGDRLPRDCGPTGDCMSAPAALYVGFGAGVVAATALDAIFLANGDAPRSQRQAAWTPVARPTRSGFALGVAGQF